MVCVSRALRCNAGEGGVLGTYGVACVLGQRRQLRQGMRDAMQHVFGDVCPRTQP